MCVSSGSVKLGPALGPQVFAAHLWTLRPFGRQKHEASSCSQSLGGSAQVFGSLSSVRSSRV